MTTTVLIESIDLTEAKFDATTRVLKDVGLIKVGKSLNRRNYSEDVLKNAVSVFEGTRAFDSHASGEKRERRVGELTGYYTNVRYDNGVIKADRHFLPTRAGQDVMAVVEAIINGAPRSLAGLSINAIGTGKMQKIDGEDVLQVESISGANSVDDVVNAAAGGEYVLTASNGDAFATQLVASMDYEEWLLARPEFVDKLKREWKTVRLEEATKTAIAASDDKVKAAVLDTQRANEALQEAQSENGTLLTANGKLMTEVQSLRLEKAVNEALDGVQLPANYVKDLREDLPKLSPSEWANKIEREISKAKRTSSEKVTVNGAGILEAQAVRLIAPPPVIEDELLPRENENIGQWQDRIARLKQNMR